MIKVKDEMRLIPHATIIQNCTIILLCWFLSGCFTVDSVDDAVDANVGDGKCEDSLGRCTLRAAIMEANSSALKNTIILPSGTYQLTLANAEGGGALEISSSMKLQGSGADTTIIEQTVQDTVFHILGGPDIEINLLTIKGGNTQAGGGVYVGSGNVEFNDLIVADNDGFTGGGGLFISSSTVARIYRTTIENNNAVGAFGGGIWNSGELWIYDSTISDNQANRSGGIHNNSTGQLNLRNVTISGNVANSPRAGTGGLHNNGFVVLNNVTMTNNSGHSRSGGLLSIDTATTVVKNSIIAGNKDLGTGAEDCSGQLTVDSRNNLIGNSEGCDINGFLSTYLLDVPANLLSLGDYGGPTRTHLPANTSPARNLGYEFPPPAVNACENSDQRGVPRPQGTGPCDMGAVEYTSSSAFVTEFIIVDADSNTDFKTLQNGDMILRNQLPDEISIRTIVTGSAGSVIFSLDGDPNFQTENLLPYSLGGDASGNYFPVVLSSGEHTLVATPYSGSNGTGATGGSMEINFNILDFSTPPTVNRRR